MTMHMIMLYNWNKQKIKFLTEIKNSTTCFGEPFYTTKLQCEGTVVPSCNHERFEIDFCEKLDTYISRGLKYILKKWNAY